MRPLVAEHPGLAAEVLDDFAARLAAAKIPWKPKLRIYGVAPVDWWERLPFACCGQALYWAPRRGNGAPWKGHRPPTCPVCKPVAARRDDPEALRRVVQDLLDPGFGVPALVLVELDRAQEADNLILDARERLAGMRARQRELEELILRGDTEELRTERAKLINVHALLRGGA
jgi:hypothetical protein